MATENNIDLIYKWEDVRLPFTMNPIPTGGIAGWTIVFTLKKKPDDEDPLVEATGVVVGDGLAGQFTVDLESADLDLPAGVYWYDVTRTDVGSRACLSIGTFTIKQEVNKA